MQLRKENPCGPLPPAVKVSESEEITTKVLITTMRRALSFYSSIQAHDGHWPAESAGPLFFLQPLVTTWSSIPIVIYLLDLNINVQTTWLV